MYLILFLLAAVVLSTLPHQRQLALATAVRATVLAPVLRLQGGFSDMRAMRDHLEELRRERDSLAERLLALQDVAEENLRLRALVDLAERSGQRFVPANLEPAGRAADLVKRSFVLDRGSASGIVDDAPVVAPAGLVGVVRIVAPRQATGDFWTHRDFRVSAMTTDGRVFGIIKPLAGDQPLMQLDGAPFQVELTRGTELVTSGMGGVFPRGIPVGRVIDVVSTEEGWAKSYRVQPAVFPDAVREVMVVLDAAEADLSDAWLPGGQP
jgi:rod shape-determining protein MreC